MRSLHGPIPPKMHYMDLNRWLKLFYRSEWQVADDFARAAIGSDLRWDYLCLYYSLANKHGRVRKLDTFGIGFEGVVSEEIINGTIHAMELQNLEELPTPYQDFWPEMRKLLRDWDAYCRVIEKEDEPGPTQPVAEKPKVQPARPVVVEKKPATEPEKKPELPSIKLPQEPVKKATSSLKWIGVSASLLLNVYFIWGNFLPPAVGGLIKSVLQIIAELF